MTDLVAAQQERSAERDRRAYIEPERPVITNVQLIDDEEAARRKATAKGRGAADGKQKGAAARDAAAQHDRGLAASGLTMAAEGVPSAAEAEVEYLTRDEMRKRVDQLRRQMQAAAKQLDFITAAQLRDQMLSLMAQLDEAPAD